LWTVQWERVWVVNVLVIQFGFATIEWQE